MSSKQKERKFSTLYLIRRFLPYFRSHRAVLALDLACAALTTVCELVLPKIVQEITDRGIEDISLLTVRFILTVGGVYLGLRIIDMLANYFMESVGHMMGARIETDMRRDLFAHLQALEHSYYDNTKVGTLMSRITSDLFDVTEFAHHCPEEFFIAGIKILGAFAILCFSSVPLTLIMFAIIPVMIVVSSRFNHRMRSNMAASRRQVGELNSQVEDSLLGIRVVKSFVGEPVEKEKFRLGNLKFLDLKKEMYRVMAGFHSSTRMFDGVMYIAVVVCGAFFLRVGRITAPELMAFLLYTTTLLTSIRRLVEFTEQFQRGMTGVERFIEVMDVPVGITDVEGARELTSVRGDIAFDHVTFRYSPDSRVVLKDVSFTVPHGGNIAIVGPSGGGKSTICNLIPRFYEPTEGRITVDGEDVRSYTMESLRRQIGIVQQDVYLFYGTVFENIEYGRPGATREEVEEAARKAGADEFIDKLPNGYDTYVGERGVKLSGGQKQRISIARVFLKNPPILILDEATSALDNQSEKLVQKSLELLSRNRTTLTIAHRLTTIKNADRILFLSPEGIEEEGTHEELMARRGAYYDLYNL